MIIVSDLSMTFDKQRINLFPIMHTAILLTKMTKNPLIICKNVI